jgi:hypothetical protein
MEYKVLNGSHDATSLERELNSHAAEGWRVVSSFQAVSWWSSRTPRVIVLERART